MVKWLTLTKQERLALGLDEPENQLGQPSKAAQWEAKLKARQQAAFERGVHPASSVALKGSETCGSCAHLVTTYKGYFKGYFKCGLTPWTFGRRTDIRKKWPACVKWEPSE